MLFKKKKEELSDQLTVYQERKAPRWGTPQYEIKAGIKINGFEGEGQLGNISISGCSIISVTYVNIIHDKIYDVKIIPEKSDNMNSFTIKMKLSWTKSSEDLFIAGFSLDTGETNYQLKQFVEILKARGIKPDYGNMRPQS